MENKEYISQTQKLADKHEALKKEAEALLLEGEKIEDKARHADRIMAITNSVNKIMEEMDEIELAYNNKILDFREKNKK